MKDGIIAGTGNSQNLKSVSDFLTRYPTYEDFAAALIAGTLPIDLNGINSAGWSQIGTVLSKDTLLAASVAEALGLTDATATPSQAIGRLATYLSQLSAHVDSVESTLNSKITSASNGLNWSSFTPTVKLGNLQAGQVSGKYRTRNNVSEILIAGSFSTTSFGQDDVVISGLPTSYNAIYGHITFNRNNAVDAVIADISYTNTSARVNSVTSRVEYFSGSVAYTNIGFSAFIIAGRS